MKTARVIDEIEKELPETLRRCRYCGGVPEIYVRADRNFRGEEGVVGTIKCTGCFVSVSSFERDERSAIVMAKSWWQRGILDA